MQVLTRTEAENWLPHAGLERDENGDLGYRNGRNLRVTVPLPDKSYRIPYLANLLLTGAYEKPFVESLVWMTGWGVAGEIGNRVGYRMVHSIRGDNRSLIVAPAHLLGAAEEVEAESLLTIAILMGWDAYFIPTSSNYFVANSNDEFTDVISRDDATHQRFLSVLQEGWGGKEW
jgi:hypothetical protein